MTSAQIRQSFLDFFAQRQHRVVPSASLLPTSPNLLFTNAGMNPFVPIFLGERDATDRRVADTQKCIRAGGKHNDLEDVGFDGYHHTFFEMLGNWSFGDYFKKEAIHWAWELLTRGWGFPKERLYVTVYRPGPGEPADEDTEAAAIWAELLQAEGLDPIHHICYSGKKDNFWMMGETGPCGPCSEIHIDLTPDHQGPSLVNADSPWCIEIWNLVFIQFNAREDGSLVPLKDRHIDTGMGFERVAGIIASTKNFTEFTAPPSNYASDIFSPLFRAIEGMTSHRYGGSLPTGPGVELNEAERIDCAFRVIADHIRTLSCAIADGIIPGNEGRNYVLRRILRRAVLYGRTLDLPEGFLSQLAASVREVLGDTFPELIAQQKLVEGVLAAEEKSFAKTLDRGLQTLEKMASDQGGKLSGHDAFVLYDTYGFPVDLTQLVVKEKGYQLDLDGFEAAMEDQRDRARAARKQTVISVADEGGEATRFVGFDLDVKNNWTSPLLDTLQIPERGTALVTAESPFYAEMGGQVGDTGTITWEGGHAAIENTTKDEGGRFLHWVSPEAAILPTAGTAVTLKVDRLRRSAIEKHHTATHLLNWALRKTLGTHIQQAGSFVGPDRLRFDFNHFQAVKPDELEVIRQLVNDAIARNEAVGAFEIPYRDKPDDVVAAFGEKYGNVVRVVDIGGFSKELCGGTHTRSTAVLQAFTIVQETAIAAGVRRIEAVVGATALNLLEGQRRQLQELAQGLSCRSEEVADRILSLREEKGQLEKQLRAIQQRQMQVLADELAGEAAALPAGSIVKRAVTAPDPGEVRSLAVRLAKQHADKAFLLAAEIDGKGVAVVAAGPAAQESGLKAGPILQAFLATVGGKGGGKPDLAMGGFPAGTDLNTVMKKFDLSV
jgi:alanyl-tRNA synthetase